MHVHYSLAHVAAGDPYLTAGQRLEFVIKVPENMMPVSKNRRLVLVPVEAAYSDDEQEVAVAQENRQVWSSLPTILCRQQRKEKKRKEKKTLCLSASI